MHMILNDIIKVVFNSVVYSACLLLSLRKMMFYI